MVRLRERRRRRTTVLSVERRPVFVPGGVIVAGGRSTRFGERDKAVADLAGVPMIRRVADRLSGVVDRLVVNCRADQRAAIDDALSGYDAPVGFAIDDDPDQGPMAGIGQGLSRVDADAYAFVVACDMPLVDPDFVAYLFERAAGRDGAVAQLDDKWFQTTHAVYRAGPMAAACEAALARDDRKIMAPLGDLNYAVVDEAEVQEHAALGPEVFENINTEAELEAVAERFF
jgi:molybdopterin-guanine dinucleotide biosynthesis protein A